MGAYIYGDSAHEHAVTSTSNGYTAAYDAAGDMLCRAPTSSTTCSGTQTGAQLTYDGERRATHWQNSPSSPTSVDDLRYDGEGNRIVQRTYQPGGINTTVNTYYLLGGQEEVQLAIGRLAVVTKYYPTGSATHLPQPMKVGSTISYLATDGLDTVSEAVDGAGNVTAQQLYLPYGGSRYSNGTMPTSKGYTGQRADAATGLDYYGARYYDPLVGQFTSADDVLPGDGLDPWGLSRYAYVEGNPIARNDPSGHCWPVCTVLLGAGIGFLVGVAADTVAQYVDNHGDMSKYDPGHAVAVGAVGAVAGAVIGFAGPTGMIAEAAATASAGSGMAAMAGVATAMGGETLGAAAVVGGIEGLAEGLADPNRSWTSVTDSAIVGSSANVVGSALGNAIGRGFTGPWRNAVSNGMGNFLGNVLPQLLVTHTWNGRSAFFAGIAGVGGGAIGGPVGVVLADFLVWGVQYLIDPPHLKQQNLVPNDVSGTASGMWTSYSTQQSSGNTRGSDAW